mmetsp:Transcript_55268/g.101289  ORF Transcript_55268/g.101289 Transcript_55268/m.101289 type:complete len:83 (-) Transcript_55268:124-372(-)
MTTVMVTCSDSLRSGEVTANPFQTSYSGPLETRAALLRPVAGAAALPPNDLRLDLGAELNAHANGAELNAHAEAEREFNSSE